MEDITPFRQKKKTSSPESLHGEEYVNSSQSFKILKIRDYSSEELDTLVVHPMVGTLNPLRAYQQVLDFTQDKLMIFSLNCQRAHQTNFDDVRS
ncbi:hypothetical protein TNCV_4977031 [Trichonephila clavipes]|nr:hypothetical protein TNCV_4977031 [Trichonephila clavipes]